MEKFTLHSHNNHYIYKLQIASWLEISFKLILHVKKVNARQFIIYF